MYFDATNEFIPEREFCRDMNLNSFFDLVFNLLFSCSFVDYIKFWFGGQPKQVYNVNIHHN